MTREPCASCTNRREGDDREFRVLGDARAADAQAVAAINQRYSELRIHVAKEAVLSRQAGAGELERRPMKHDWCAVKSVPDAKMYFLCEQQGPKHCDQYRGLNEPHAGEGRDAPPRTVAGAQMAGASVPRGHERREECIGSRLRLGPAARLVPRLVDAGPGEYAQQFEYELLPEPGEEIHLSGEALYQTCMIFGGPGAGKTHLFHKLLSQVLSISEPSRPGCLILDPKGVMEPKLRIALEEANRPQDDLRVVRAGSNHRMNILGRSAAPRQLGRLIAEVVLAEAPGVDETWSVLVMDLLEAAAVVTAAYSDGGALTARSLLSSVLAPKRLMQLGDGPVTEDFPIVAYARSVHSRSPAADVVDACERIEEFYHSTEDRQRRFIRQMIGSLGDLRSPEWQFLSPDDPDEDLYDDIIERQRIVLISVGQSAPAFQRSLCSLAKAVFQQAVLTRLSRVGSAREHRRLSVLATDEYAQVVTEGRSGLVSDSQFFSQSREAGCLSLLALQSVATARSRFPQSVRDRWDGILGNVGIKVFMRLNDPETAALASSLAGKGVWLLPLMSTGLSASGSSMSEGLTPLSEDRVPGWFLTNRLAQGEAFVHGSLDGQSAPTVGFVLRERP